MLSFNTPESLPPYSEFVVPGRYRAPRPATTPTPLRWVRTAELAAASVRLASLLPPGVGAIAGVPRSGLIPASIIAALLHLPLYEMRENASLYKLGHGRRGEWNGRSGSLAVIDDTVYSGTAMMNLREAWGDRAVTYAVVYARKEGSSALDCYAEELPGPHLLEWNLFNNSTIKGYALDPQYWQGGLAADLDGVLLHDAYSGGKLGTPYLLPRSYPIPLVVTGRPERQRGATVAQLALWETRYERLEMLPDSEPLTVETAARYKAYHYARSGCGFFVESCPYQAERIHQLSGKPAICPLAGRIWHRGE